MDLDLAKILEGVANAQDLIKQIEAEIGKEYVPRTEFNAKNTELKNAQSQLGDLQTSLDGLTKEKSTWEKTVGDLNDKVSGYEKAALKAKIAHEVGLPYELASRLAGEDEAAIRADAESFAGFIKTKELPPLASTEPAAGSSENAAYLSLLQDIGKE